MLSNGIDYITIKGFKSIASIEKLALRPINVLIGANGSGKSNFIGVFGFLHSIGEGRLDRYVATAGGAEKLLHFGSKTTGAIGVSFAHRRGVLYELRLDHSDDDGLVVVDMLSFPEFEGQQPLPSPSVPKGAVFLRGDLGKLIVGWRVYHLHDTSSSSPMRRTAKVDDNRFLRPDFANLAAFLYFLRERHADSYDLIRKTIQRVAPFFQDFSLEPLSLSPENIKLEWKHTNSDGYFGASSLSDGTLRFIALATLFLQPKHLRPSLILVDEPELGLHPSAIGLLASMIQQAAVDTQVIVSTQSSLLLDYFEPEDILVADCIEGATTLTRLDSARLAKWLEDYSLGELWEKNEIGGRPGSN